MNPNPKNRVLPSFRALALGLLWGASAGASAFSIPNTPLFLASDVQPNIFFALDDSGSMDWEILKSNGARTAFPATPDDGNLDFSANTITEDREACAGYNVMAYNPAKTYTPWIGVDSASVAYANQPITAARVDPLTAASGTTKLTDVGGGRSAMYGTFVDANGDGVFQSAECPVGSGSSTYNLRTYGDARTVLISTLTAAQKTNYANWYTFYRKREFVLKRAVSELITNSTSRIGIATLHNNNAVGTAVADMTVPANKTLLLSRLFKINSLNATPLRTLLNRVGHYFDQAGANSLHSALGFATASPILSAANGGECQQNFTVLFSDGFWNDAFAGFGNKDSDGAESYDGGPHADANSNTLADVAMDYYERDLSTTLANEVPTILNVDENATQHMVTYTVSFGLQGTLDAAPTNHLAATAPPPWPTPVADQLTTADDMLHASFNARGAHIAGQNPQQVIDGLNAAFNDIGTRTGSASAIAATSQSIQEDTLVFQGRFDTDKWNGELKAIEFNVGGVFGQTLWEASEHIPVENSRTIFTYKPSAGDDGIEFEWRNLSAAQQTSIGNINILDYVRGDRTLEVAQGGAFRDRISLLGDIIFSSPTAVTNSRASIPYQFLPGAEGDSFFAYVDIKEDRVPTVYVGANDGMLHAFRISDGVEQFAYVPQAVFSNLDDLASLSYTHTFYVDGTLSTGDAYIGGDWRTMLVGALGRGGKALFALDITTPDSFDEGDVKWEFTHAELGYMLGSAEITRMNNGEWVAIVGNGVNSTSHKAQLLIINLSDGTLMKMINTNVGSADSQNGLSTPLLIDIDQNLTTDFIYAGDVQGNLWKFDVSGNTSGSWVVDLGGSPLYTAKNPAGNAQAITTKPNLAVRANNDFVILFGTGRYFATGDDLVTLPAPVETVYGILDADVPVATVGARAAADGNAATIQTSTILQAQELLQEVTADFGANTETVRTVTARVVNYATQHGWYLDLLSPADGAEGERVIADYAVRELDDGTQLLLFNTFTPATGCENSGGKSFLMAIDALNGGAAPSPVLDYNYDGVFDAEDLVGGHVGAGIEIGLTVAPTTIISSDDGGINYFVSSALNGDGPGGDDDDDECEEGDDECRGGNSPAGKGNRLFQGRQSWRQLQ